MGKARVKRVQQTREIKEIKQIAQGCMRRTSVCGHPEPREERTLGRAVNFSRGQAGSSQERKNEAFGRRVEFLWQQRLSTQLHLSWGKGPVPGGEGDHSPPSILLCDCWERAASFPWWGGSAQSPSVTLALPVCWQQPWAAARQGKAVQNTYGNVWKS